MKVEVIMPQMGESIAEGTVTKWLKKPGEHVRRDEPLFEISTDKVDAEIPSPAEGVLAEVLVHEGETVPIQTVVAYIETDKEAVEAPPREVSERATPVAEATPRREPTPEPARVAPSAAEEPSMREIIIPPHPWEKQKQEIRITIPAERLERKAVRSSPVVEKLAQEYGIDLTQIEGTGRGGRVTKRDVLRYLEERAARPSEARPQPIEAPELETPLYPPYLPGERVEIVPMSVMRKKIAEHMVYSKRVAPHVTTFFEIDMTRVSRLRDQLQPDFEQRHGVKLTYLPFIVQACVSALKAFPILNASIADDKIVYKKDINIGIAVALEWGLIVPVIKNADALSLVGLAKAIHDLATRARNKQLKPEEVQGGTFTITNPGVFGSLFGTPVINQPQVAILGVGRIAKRPVVVEDDAIAIRAMAYFSLSFDHRLIDGAVADQFMAHIKRTLESFELTGA
ncbi:MAG: dihydrolipoyllysine-residue succinyltransferase [Blastocatellia bacterium]|nr:dihydrolipoyllysine-residue succinyltransferase [Blastocatellia bacterium]MCS7157126.1 dihydrolipoyllysine-residue succinyltransferase [Blastocatellia bacterium]MCX7752411.1 dihydrolipoyllysine-residue succinyltransferase [Blastocatellia bacterium]MDW8167294.1 dihydrolipoyllysine-residue succinyltransferase [Acidobacteriota bacterium]